MPIIRLKETRETPVLKIPPDQHWHLFLSHVWSTGQDQCATIKRQVVALLPYASVFLDTDDLKEIGALEEYVEQSRVFMLFVSKGYFKSKSSPPLPSNCGLRAASNHRALRDPHMPAGADCLREIRKADQLKKKIVLMHDPVRGGATVEYIKKEECPKDLLRIFKRRDIIIWHRIKVRLRPPTSSPRPQYIYTSIAIPTGVPANKLEAACGADRHRLYARQ